MGEGVLLVGFAVFVISAIGLSLFISEDKKKQYLDKVNKF